MSENCFEESITFTNDDGLTAVNAPDRPQKLLAVVGPTASGKTRLAVQLAIQFGGEIVSCDSMQIYKNMPVATAAPTPEEMAGVSHHLLQFVGADEDFSVARYCELAKKVIADVARRGRLPILCGGTGLYYNSLVDGIAFSEVPELPELREELAKRALTQGGEILLRELAQFDEPTALRLKPADTRRIVRAIEVYRATGITMTEHIRLSRLRPPEYDLLAIGLDYHDRKRLYERIDQRVDRMLESGLIDEARAFFSANYGKTAAQAIGYKELRPYLDGACLLEDAAERLKMGTRRYAKRQLSWFRRDDRIRWIYVDEYASFAEVQESAAALSKEFIYG